MRLTRNGRPVARGQLGPAIQQIPCGAPHSPSPFAKRPNPMFRHPIPRGGGMNGCLGKATATITPAAPPVSTVARVPGTQTAAQGTRQGVYLAQGQVMPATNGQISQQGGSAMSPALPYQPAAQARAPAVTTAVQLPLGVPVQSATKPGVAGQAVGAGYVIGSREPSSNGRPSNAAIMGSGALNTTRAPLVGVVKQDQMSQMPGAGGAGGAGGGIQVPGAVAGDGPLGVSWTAWGLGAAAVLGVLALSR